ncbi:MAG: hypothetical protein QXM62_06340 [Ignisphaera sp.]
MRSLIVTVVVVSVYVLGAVRRSKPKVCSSVVFYKLDESGNLTRATPESLEIPLERLKAIQEELTKKLQHQNCLARNT